MNGKACTFCINTSSQLDSLEFQNEELLKANKYLLACSEPGDLYLVHTPGMDVFAAYGIEGIRAHLLAVQDVRIISATDHGDRITIRATENDQHDGIIVTHDLVADKQREIYGVAK